MDEKKSTVEQIGGILGTIMQPKITTSSGIDQSTKTWLTSLVVIALVGLFIIFKKR